MTPDHVFLGWDVGGWNCDKNPASRDALCAICERGGRLEPVGAWRGNLRGVLVDRAGGAMIAELLRLVGIGDSVAVTIAIDTPLGWPSSMVELVTRGEVAAVPRAASANPYLFRAQERALFEACSPLSAVRDMIGSQSTKGIHFLHQAQLEPSGVGVWSTGGVTAIETYPAAARTDAFLDAISGTIAEQVRAVAPPRVAAAWLSDVVDAGTAAVVAWLYHRHPDRLRPPPLGADPMEGWIWLPVGVGPA